MIHRVVVGLAALVALAAPAAADDHTLAQRLASASVEKGEQLFKRCRACHTIARGAENGNGPNLWGIVGRPVASAAGFPYSPALREKGGAWTVERIDAFLTDPHEDVSGTRMPFIGLDKPHARADLIAFLNSNSETPIDLAALVGPGEAAPIEEEEPEYGVFVVAPGVDETYAYCTACHSERLVAQQGMSRDDWAELVEWMVDEQGMGEMDDEDLTIVLDYLAANYNTDRPNFPVNR